MHSTDWREIIVSMRERGIEFHAGLTAVKFSTIQEQYRLAFPDDLRAFLSIAMPHGEKFPDWRGDDALRKQINWPLDGLLFDLQHNALWRPAWGSKPADPVAAQSRLRELVAVAPRLIPLFGHRYLPATPASECNAVLSVYQSDIIRYAPNLAHWLNAEFSLGLSLPPASECVNQLPFWDDLIGI